MELLIRNYDRNALPDWQIGDIVMVKPQGHEWGKQEDPRTRTDDPVDLFSILVVPGKSPGVRLAQNLMVAWMDGDDLQARGKWRVDMFALPAGVQAQLSIDGTATIGWGAFRDNLIYVPDPLNPVDPEDG